MSTVTVREITDEDYENVVAMCNYTKSVSFKDILPQALIDDQIQSFDVRALGDRVVSGKYWIAETDDRKIVGVIGLIKEELRTFFVHPDYQGVGVGRKLYDVFETYCRDHGIVKLSVVASAIGTPIYVHFGFRIVGKKKKERVGIKYEDTVLEKVL